MKIRAAFVGVLALVLAQSAFAGDPTYNGLGCPEGTVSFSTTPDGGALSVLFDSFSVEAGGPAAQKTNIKACHLILPIAVPAGKRLGVTKIDYRGFNKLPAKAKAEFYVSYSLDGRPMPPFHKQFVGEQSANFEVTDTIGAGQMKWSGCGETFFVDALTSMQLVSGEGPALSTVDSIDTSAGARGGLVYHLQYKNCQ